MGHKQHRLNRVLNEKWCMYMRNKGDWNLTVSLSSFGIRTLLVRVYYFMYTLLDPIQFSSVVTSVSALHCRYEY